MPLRYPIKVNLFRLAALVLVLGAWVLYTSGLEDYALLIEIIFVFGCIFSISMAEIDSELVVVRKCYCWGMISVKKRISFNCLLSMRPKDYGLNASGGLDIGPDNIFVSFFVDLFKPKVTWVV